MKRLAKIVAIVLMAIIVLIIVAAIVLPLVFDPNDYKSEITTLVENKIGRQVEIPGEIELSVFPWLGVSIGKVTVANAPGFGDKPLAEIADASVHVKLLPLLQGQIQVGTVALDGLRLRLARNAQGQTNWQGIVQHLQSANEAAATGKSETKKEPTGQSQGGGALSSLQIGSIAVRDAAITWSDASAGQSYKLSDFHLITGALVQGQPFEIDTGAVLSAPGQGMTGQFSAEATIKPDMSKGIYRFADVTAQAQVKGDAIPGGSQTLSLATHGFLNLSAGQMALKDIAVELAGLDVSGSVSGKGLNQTPQFAGQFKVAQFDPRAVLDNLGMALPELQSDDALRSAQINVKFSATPSRMQIGQLRVKLDDSVFVGSASVENFSAPVIAFNADVDTFNLDHYLPVARAQETAGEPATQSGENKGQTASGKIDLSFLRGPTVDGKLHVGTLTAYDMTFNDAKLAIGIHDGVLTIKPLASGFYDGSIHVVARVDASDAVPRYSLQANLNKLKFAPLLKDLVGTDLVSALASLKLDLTSSGDTVSAIKKALDGTISYDLRDGTFHGFNLARLVAVAKSRLTGGGTALADADRVTPFSKLAGTFNINNGVVSGDGLSLDTKYLGAVGDGQYNLLANNLDYNLKLQVDKKSAGPLAEIAGLTVPIHLTGSLLSPQYSIDVEAALKAVAKQHLQDEKAELKKKLQDKLSDELGDQANDKLKKKLQQGLSDLFN